MERCSEELKLSSRWGAWVAMHLSRKGLGEISHSGEKGCLRVQSEKCSPTSCIIRISQKVTSRKIENKKPILLRTEKERVLPTASWDHGVERAVLSRCEITIQLLLPSNPKVASISLHWILRPHWEPYDHRGSDSDHGDFGFWEQKLVCKRIICPSTRSGHNTIRRRRGRAQKGNYILVSICSSAKWRY